MKPCLRLPRSTGSANKNNAANNKDRRKDLLPGEGIHACPDTYDGRNDGLEVGVHAHEGGPDELLAVRNEEVSHKGGEKNEVPYFPKHIPRDGGIICGQETFGRYRQGDNQGKQERRTDRLESGKAGTKDRGRPGTEEEAKQ